MGSAKTVAISPIKINIVNFIKMEQRPINKKKKFVADGVFKAEIHEF